MRYILLTCTLLLFISPIFAKKNFVKGVLGFTDGDTLHCEIVLKIKNQQDNALNQDHKRILYRNFGSDEIKKAFFDELEFILVDTHKGEVLLVQNQYFFYTGTKRKLKKTKEAYWFQYRGGCEDIKSYLLVHEFEVDRDGKLWAIYWDEIGSYLLQRKDEEAPTIVGNVFLRKVITQKLMDKERRKMLEVYFKGDPDGEAFLKGKKRIEQKELKEYVMNRCGQ